MPRRRKQDGAARNASRPHRTAFPKRGRTWWRHLELPTLWGLAFVSLWLGYIGFQRHFLAIASPRSSLEILYRSLQLFALEFGDVSGRLPWQLEVARLLAPS